MTKSRILTVVLGLASGFAGSLLTRYVTPPTAFAQNQPAAKPAQEIRAQSFTLVGPRDNTIATFSVEPPNRHTPSRIVLRDAAGNVLWSASRWDIQPLSER